MRTAICTLALLSACLPAAEEIPRHLLELEDTSYYGIYDRDQKAGWSKVVQGTVEIDGERVYRHHIRDETVGLYFGEKQTLIFEQEELYQIKPPYHLLSYTETSEERGFKKRIVITPDPDAGKGALQAEITEGTNVRKLKVKSDGKPMTLIDFWAVEIALQRDPQVGKRHLSRYLDSEDLVITPASFLVLEKLDKHTFRVGLEAEPEGRYATAHVRPNGEWPRYTFTGGSRYEQVANEEEAKAALGHYSFETMWEVSIDKPLAPPGTITELVVKAKGDWSDALENTDLQSFHYDAAKDTTTIKVGQRFGSAAEVTKEDREKALRATSLIPAQDPKIKKLAQQATAGAKNEREKVERLCAFVARTLDYQIDLDPLSIHQSLVQKRGDCSEHSDLFSALARSLGIPARSVSGWIYVGNDEQVFGYHAWNEVVLDGKWISLDPTWIELTPNATHIKMMVEDADSSYTRRIRDGELAFEIVSVKSDPEPYLQQAEKLIDKYPKEAAWLEARANLHYDQGRTDDLMRDLKRAVALAPGNAELREFLAGEYLDQGELERALAEQRKATTLSPKHAGYWETLAFMEEEAGNYEGAISSINKALQLRPDKVDYLGWRSYFHFRNDDADAAMIDIDKALALAPDQSDLHNSKGRLCLHFKRHALAEQSFTHALGLEPGNPEFLLSRAIARYQLKKIPGAREDLKAARKTDDLDEELRKEIEKWLEALEKP